MHRILTLSAAVLFLLPAYSQAADEKPRCDQVESVATATMEARQAGVPMSEMIQMANDVSLMVFMTEQAYEEPQYRTEQYRKDAVRRFADKWFRECYKLRKAQSHK